MFTHTGEIYIYYLDLTKTVKLTKTTKSWIDEDGIKYRKDTGKIRNDHVPYLRLETIKPIEE